MKRKTAAMAAPSGDPALPTSTWQAVAVGDELLIGAEEGGFLELEEFRPPAAQQPSHAADAATQQVPKLPGQQKRARPAPGAGMVGALQAEVTRLRGENQQLRAAAEPAPAAAGPSPEVEPGAGQQASHTAPHSAAKSARKLAKLAKARELRQRMLERRKLAKAAKQRRQQAAAAKAPAGAAAKAHAGAAACAPAAADAGPPAAEAPRAAPAAGGWAELGLHPQLLAGLATQGFAEPTLIQRECLPAAIRDRRDVIGAAQTGSGKTLAFGLPILQALLAERDAGGDEAGGGRASDRRGRGGGGLRALVLAPTRELALQVCAHLDALARPASVWAVPIVGGLAPAKQARLLGRRPAVVVATPGRLWELMREGAPHLTEFSALSFLARAATRHIAAHCQGKVEG